MLWRMLSLYWRPLVYAISGYLFFRLVGLLIQLWKRLGK